MSEEPASTRSPVDVLLWATKTGGGHRRVAEALRAALLAESRGALRVAIEDPLAAGARPHARALLLAYGPLVRTSPLLWGLLFRTFARPWARKPLESFLLSGLAPAMTRVTQARQPRVVVNCHPLLGPAALRASSRLSAPAPLVTMITDLAVVHPGWLSPPTANFLSPSAVATSWCVAQGIPAERVVEVGLPIDPGIGEQVGPEAKARLRSELGLDPRRLVVVMGGGAEGAGRLRPLVAAVLGSGLPLQLVVLCGRNQRLLHWLHARPRRLPLVALPYTPDPTPWLLAADVYVGKAGPSALAEAAAAGLAILVSAALPGQERSNLVLLQEASAGLRVAGRVDLLEALGRLSIPGDPLLHSLRQGALAWARPAAARGAAREIMSLL